MRQKRVNLKSKELPGPFEFDANDSRVGSSGLIRLATLRPTRDNEAFCSFPAEARRICSYILEALGRQINILDVGLMKCRDVRDRQEIDGYHPARTRKSEGMLTLNIERRVSISDMEWRWRWR